MGESQKRRVAWACVCVCVCVSCVYTKKARRDRRPFTMGVSRLCRGAIAANCPSAGIAANRPPGRAAAWAAFCDTTGCVCIGKGTRGRKIVRGTQDCEENQVNRMCFRTLCIFGCA